jgi:hypothetical protein
LPFTSIVIVKGALIQNSGNRHRRTRLSQVLGLLETVGKGFDAALSNDAACENAVPTFAYEIILNMNGLRGMGMKRDRQCASIRVPSITKRRAA